MRMIYYLPGRGGRLDSGLGLELISRGYSVVGREITRGRRLSDPEVEDFSKLSFPDQVAMIVNDLTTLKKNDIQSVIAYSFGAYLLLHAYLEIGTNIGRTLLLSPVLGASRVEGFYFRPPQAHRIKTVLEDQAFPNLHLHILVGSEDDQSDQELCQKLHQATIGTLEVVNGEGHRLDSDTVKAYLDRWLIG